MIGRDIVIILHHLVDDSVGRQFNDAIGHGLDELMVVRSKKDVSLVNLQVIVESLDGLQVQVVGRRVQNKAIGVAQLHTGYHATHLLAAGQDAGYSDPC